MQYYVFCGLLFRCVICLGNNTYVDTGNPYTDRPLKVGGLTLSKTGQKSPLHTKVYFPLEPGFYPAVLFIGGFDTYVLAEYYETVLSRIASHGFFIFGIDYAFPLEKQNLINAGELKQDISKYFEQHAWLQHYMTNKTLGTVSWNSTALMCHSSGCDATLKMIREKPTMFTSTIFLEPVSFDVKEKVDIRMPAFMYGTELSTVGHQCVIPGFSYNKFYEIWGCPKIVMEVADFGHCDILDTVPWTGCKDVHFCTITPNVTKLTEYKEFVQGATSSFLVSSLQGRTDAMKYITQKPLIPLRLLELRSDLNCTEM
ncbi:Hypothetical predicted protein [Mytilus galloprovincialis]|uniref:Chlorophyllase n=1 Tax=Mytilus galloprovincialis TaxID=29158 RepID=A0A8B6H093_MYTGA|nr:Hypothetical predicted protein [Mytilus galloprovincialis]